MTSYKKNAPSEMSETELKKEEELIARAKSDLREFSALYDLYLKRVYSFFITRLGNTEEAEDFTSHTFLKAIENFDRYSYDGKPFGVWLFRIARNLLIDLFRKKKMPTVNIDEAYDVSSSEDIEEKTHSKMLYEKVQLLLQEFSSEEQEIILLKLSSGLKFSEIANILGKNESTIKTKYFRTLEKLKGRADALVLILLLLTIS